MTAKKEETKKVDEKEVKTPKEEIVNTKIDSTAEPVPAKVDDHEEAEKVETGNDPLPSSAGENDTAVEMSKSDYSSALPPTVQEIDDSSDRSQEIIENDEVVKEAISEGNVTGMTAAQISVASKPLVADLVTGRPVYETAEQAMLAQSAAGKLSTPPASEVPEEED